MGGKEKSERRTVARNRRATHDFAILDRIEARSLYHHA